MIDDDAVIDKAMILIADIKAALGNGVKHFALDGRALLTVQEVLDALRVDGSIRLEEARRAAVVAGQEVR